MKLAKYLNEQEELPDEIFNQARQDLKSAPRDVQEIIEESALKINVGYKSPIDRIFDEKIQKESIVPPISPDEFYQSFKKTRKVLKDIYGKYITLYRLQGKDLIPDKHTLYFVKSIEFLDKFKEMYSDEDRNLEEYNVPIKDIIAVNVATEGKYEEFIVFNHRSEGLLLPESYGR